MLAGCYSDIRIATIDGGIASTPLSVVSILALPPYAYPVNHTIDVLKNRDFSVIAHNALETAIRKKKRGWKIINSANLTSTVPSIINDILNNRQLDTADTATQLSMKNLSTLFNCRYLFVIEQISTKDISNAQTPSTMLMGAWLQVWDMEKGIIAYRVRNVTRPISYADNAFEERLFTALYDLFSAVLRPLPKN